MSLNPYVFGAIVGMALVTAIPRILPLVVLSRLTLPDWLMRWLSYVPVAVLAALLARELLIPGGGIQLPPENLGLVAALPTFIVALWSRNLMATVLVGIGAMALLRAAVG